MSATSCCVASQQRVIQAHHLLRFSPDRQLVGHHHFVISVGHQQPYGILQDAFDELLLAAIPASAAAAPCWLFAGMVVLRGVDAPKVLAGVAALAAAWIDRKETERRLSDTACKETERLCIFLMTADVLVPLVPVELQPLEPEPEPDDLVPEEPEPEAAEPVPERESSCSIKSSRSLEVDMASWLDSLVSP